MKGKEGFANIEEIQARVSKVKETNYIPNMKEHEVYSKIYQLYKNTHDTFGIKEYKSSLYNVMKKLIEIKKGHNLGVTNEWEK